MIEKRKRFTFHIVNIKLEKYFVISRYYDKFTFHIVNIKQVSLYPIGSFTIEFTFHIVNIKPQNKLSIFNTYTYTTLLNLQ